MEVDQAWIDRAVRLQHRSGAESCRRRVRSLPDRLDDALAHVDGGSRDDAEVPVHRDHTAADHVRRCLLAGFLHDPDGLVLGIDELGEQLLLRSVLAQHGGEWRRRPFRGLLDGSHERHQSFLVVAGANPVERVIAERARAYGPAQVTGARVKRQFSFARLLRQGRDDLLLDLFELLRIAARVRHEEDARPQLLAVGRLPVAEDDPPGEKLPDVLAHFGRPLDEVAHHRAGDGIAGRGAEHEEHVGEALEELAEEVSPPDEAFVDDAVALRDRHHRQAGDSGVRLRDPAR